jgi:hypothetical protein
LKEEALARNVWRTGFGRRHGPVVRQTKEWIYSYTMAISLLMHSRLYVLDCMMSCKPDFSPKLPASLHCSHRATPL